MATMSRTTRILKLRAALLQGAPVLDAAGWARHFEVDARTIQRDLAYLRRQEGMSIHYDPHLAGYARRPGNPQPVRESKASKFLRLMDLIHRISAEPGKTSQQLADEMGCTARTIFRDLADLQEHGLPIYNDNGYRFAAGAFMRPLSLQPRELFALFLGARLLESLDGGQLGPDARKAMEKLLRAISDDKRPDLGSLRSTVQVAEPSEDTGLSQLLELQGVVGNGRQLCLTYQGLNDEQAKSRTVDPMGLFGFRQVWYLRAFDHLRHDYRSFRLTRIVDWRLLETPVQHPARMELQEAVYHRWDCEGRPTVTVELQVSEALARWLDENPPHPSQTIAHGRVAYQVCDLAAVARWAAGLHGLEILAPPALRQEMHRLGAELQALYAQPD
jgi:predicted DNA-binding transcriptional regulator YafY